MRWPRALARSRPSAVRAWISSRSNSAKPPRTVSTSRPCGVVVSAHVSASDRNPALRSVTAASVLRRPRVERARRSSLVTTSTSPGSSAAIARRSRARSALAPLTASRNTFRHPALLVAGPAPPHSGRPSTPVRSRISCRDSAPDLCTRKAQPCQRANFGTEVLISETAATCHDGAYVAAILKELRDLTPYEFICRAWTKKPERFRLDPSHPTLGLNTRMIIEYQSLR